MFRLAVKPTPSIAKQQQTVSLSKKQVEELVVTGRHDPASFPGAVPVVEAVTVFANFLRKREEANFRLYLA